MRAALVSLLLLCFASPVSAVTLQGKARAEKNALDSKKPVENRVVRSPELVGLLDEAGRCAPEFRADAYLRLAPRARLDDIAWERELVEQAFDDAKYAWLKTPLGWWHAGMSTDSDDGTLLSAGETGFDALSLRCRAVSSMIDIDRKRALEMFESISWDSTNEAIRCDTVSLPDLRTYYETLVRIESRCFTTKERQRGDNIAFIESHLAKSASPLEVGPALLTAAALVAKGIEAAVIVRALKTGMERSVADRAAFEWAGRVCSVPESIETLRSSCKSDRETERILLGAYRTFLVKNLSASACVMRGVSRSDGVHELIEKFNAMVDDAQKVERREIEPAQTVQFDYDPGEWWTSAPSFAALTAAQRLNRKSGTKEAWSEPERASEEYKQLYNDAIAKTEAWTSMDEANEGVYFYMKCSQYAFLVRMSPVGQPRLRAIGRLLDFLSLSQFARSKPAMWILPLQYLYATMPDGGELQSAIMERFRDSREPAVRLFVELKDLEKGLRRGSKDSVR